VRSACLFNAKRRYFARKTLQDAQPHPILPCRLAFASATQQASTPDNAGPPQQLFASSAAERWQTPVSGSTGPTRSASRSPAISAAIERTFWRNAGPNRHRQTRSSIPPTALKRGLEQHRLSGTCANMRASMFHRFEAEAGFVARTKALMNFPSTCGAMASTSMPFSVRNSRASSTLYTRVGSIPI
jgi:hypothetical protein